MKIHLLTSFVFALSLLVSVSACKSNRVIYRPVDVHASGKGMPPGQAKKVYGHQSAKAFAPGQQKKYGKPNSKEPKANKNPKGKGKK